MGSKYFFTAAMDIPTDKEQLFNEVYDEEHIPYLSEVPGVLSIARFTSCLLYTSPSPRDRQKSRMPSSA